MPSRASLCSICRPSADTNLKHWCGDCAPYLRSVYSTLPERPVHPAAQTVSKVSSCFLRSVHPRKSGRISSARSASSIASKNPQDYLLLEGTQSTTACLQWEYLSGAQSVKHCCAPISGTFLHNRNLILIGWLFIARGRGFLLPGRRDVHILVLCHRARQADLHTPVLRPGVH